MLRLPAVLTLTALLVGACAAHSAAPTAPVGAGAATALPEGFVRLQPGVLFKEVAGEPGQHGRLWLYVPESAPGPRGRPLVVVPPAGSNLLTGMVMGEGDRPEHLPYVRTGFVVVSFDISGALPEAPTREQWMAASGEFSDARLGVQDGVAALNYALGTLPELDRARVYLAGHSSAGTLVLQIAAEEPRVAAVAAFAPVTDLGFWLHEALELEPDPDMEEFVRQGPLALADRLTRPVLLVHGTGDRQAPVEESRKLARRLAELGRPPTYEEVEGGEHHRTMLEVGIPTAIEWFGALERAHGTYTPPSGPVVDAQAWVRGGAFQRGLDTFSKACEQGVSRACLGGGGMLAAAFGVPADPARARALLERACRLDATHCNDAGRVMWTRLRGEGSTATFRTGCEHGDQDACLNEGRALSNGTDGPPDPARARALYEQACALSVAEGCYMLASSFASPEFGPVDHAQEHGHRRRACELGMEEACRMVHEEETRTGPQFEDMINAIYAHEKEILACAEKHGASDREVLPLSFTFVSSGALEDVQVDDPALVNRALLPCIRKAVGRVRLEPFKAPRHKLDVEMSLKKD